MTCCQCRGIEDMFGDRMARRQLRHYRRKGPGRATRQLLDAIAGASAGVAGAGAGVAGGSAGVAGGTFIDIGGGVGAIQHELMARGTARGTSADASPAYLAAARAEAEARGYADRMTYVEGDFVREANKVEPADIVTLDRVVCCYPDMPALLGAAAVRARRTLGLIFPRGTRIMRAGVAVVNFFQRLRRHPFRVFVHDPDEVEAVLARHGMSRSYLRDGMVWRVLVVARDGPRFDDRPLPTHIPSMRRPVAILAFAALTSSQLVALRCDMGASAHHEAAGHAGAPAHQAATHEAVPGHEAAGHEAGRAARAGAHETAPHHADRDACLMMMACGTASIRAVRTVAVARIPAPFVRAASSAPAIPVAADLAVETPPPRLAV